MSDLLRKPVGETGKVHDITVESARGPLSGDWGYVGRVYDEVGIELKSSEPTEFYILAWQGPAAKASLSYNVFAAAGRIRSQASSSVSHPTS